MSAEFYDEPDQKVWGVVDVVSLPFVIHRVFATVGRSFVAVDLLSRQFLVVANFCYKQRIK